MIFLLYRTKQRSIVQSGRVMHEFMEQDRLQRLKEALRLESDPLKRSALRREIAMADALLRLTRRATPD